MLPRPVLPRRCRRRARCLGAQRSPAHAHAARARTQRLDTLLHGGAGIGEAQQRELRRAPEAADGGKRKQAAAAAAAAARRGLGGARGSGDGPQLQVLLRLQMSRPRLHNVLTTIKLSLAGAGALS